MESSILYLHNQLYIPSIQKLIFHLPHVIILGTHHCGNTPREAFKRHSAYQNLLCRCNYAEHLVARFAHQIKSEYHGIIISVSIEGIASEHFIDTDQETSQ